MPKVMYVISDLVKRKKHISHITHSWMITSMREEKTSKVNNK